MSAPRYTPSRGADEYDPSAPVLAMADWHVELICCRPPRKWTTLRTQTLRGWYALSIGGQRTAVVRIEPVRLKGRDKYGFYWTSLTPREREGLARSEGYDTAAGFEAALRKLKRWTHLHDFLDGRRPLILHRIVAVRQL